VRSQRQTMPTTSFWDFSLPFGHDEAMMEDVGSRFLGWGWQMVSPFLVRQIVESGLHFHLRAQFIWLRHHEEVSSSSHGQNRKLCSGSAARFFRGKTRLSTSMPFHFLFSLFYLISFSLTLFWPHFRWLGFICCLIAPLVGVFFIFFHLVEEMWRFSFKRYPRCHENSEQKTI